MLPLLFSSCRWPAVPPQPSSLVKPRSAPSNPLQPHSTPQRAQPKQPAQDERARSPGAHGRSVGRQQCHQHQHSPCLTQTTPHSAARGVGPAQHGPGQAVAPHSRQPLRGRRQPGGARDGCVRGVCGWRRRGEGRARQHVCCVVVAALTRRLTNTHPNTAHSIDRTVVQELRREAAQTQHQQSPQAGKQKQPPSQQVRCCRVFDCRLPMW